MFDLGTGLWSVQETSGEKVHLPSALSGVSCTVAGGSLYTFGGWDYGSRTADVHQLDLTTFVWRRRPSTNRWEGPYLKDKAGMVAYGEDMLVIFGGYGYPSVEHVLSPRQPGASYVKDSSFSDLCWTNELHLFVVEKGEGGGEWV